MSVDVIEQEKKQEIEEALSSLLDELARNRYFRRSRIQQQNIESAFQHVLVLLGGKEEVGRLIKEFSVRKVSDKETYLQYLHREVISALGSCGITIPYELLNCGLLFVITPEKKMETAVPTDYIKIGFNTYKPV